MDYTIRRLKPAEVGILDTFLYEAIFIPEGVDAPPKEIIAQPELQVYVRDFGRRDGDLCFVAESGGQVIAACWVRFMHDYGYVDDKTPSLAISVLKDHRRCGIGTKLMKRMLEELKRRGCRQTSLSVQKANYAVRMYQRVGYEIIAEHEDEYIMLCRL